MTDYTHEVVRETPPLPARFETILLSGHVFPAHWHEYLEIVCLTGGTMRTVVQAEERMAGPGDIIIANPGDIHMTESHACTYFLLQISGRRLHELYPESGLPRLRTFLSAGEAETAELNALLAEMAEIYRKKREGYPLLFSARLYDFLYLLAVRCREPEQNQTQSRPERDAGRLTQAVNWIDMHYAEPLTLADAARQANLSREHFCRLFRRYTGQTFLEYLNTRRTIRVAEDLLTAEEPVSELLLRHGIASYRVFSRIFKSIYGDTPQKYREKGRENRNGAI